MLHRLWAVAACVVVSCQGTRITFASNAPSDRVLDDYVASLSSRRHNHAFVGQTANAPPLDLPPAVGVGTLAATRTLDSCQAVREIRCCIHLGTGGRTFERARDALLGWKMHEDSPRTSVRLGTHSDLATVASLGPVWLPLWVFNPCRKVYMENRPRTSAVSYATLERHLIAGEERMSVVWKADDTVIFQVVSLSRGAGWLGRLLFPWLGPEQRRFFEEQARCMRNLVQQQH
jgi:uncharacterized protein (UPF0548 family)